jgi:hypothetical protein
LTTTPTSATTKTSVSTSSTEFWTYFLYSIL